MDDELLVEAWEEHLPTLKPFAWRIASLYGIRYLADDILSETFMVILQMENPPELYDGSFINFSREVIRRQALHQLQREVHETRKPGEPAQLRRRILLDTILQALDSEMALSDGPFLRGLLENEGLVELHQPSSSVTVDKTGSRLETALEAIISESANAPPASAAWRVGQICAQLLHAARNSDEIPTIQDLHKGMEKALQRQISYTSVYNSMRIVRDSIRPGFSRVKGGGKPGPRPKIPPGAA